MVVVGVNVKPPGGVGVVVTTMMIGVRVGVAVTMVIFGNGVSVGVNDGPPGVIV